MPKLHFISPLEETVVIVGVGLIGGSLAAALKCGNIARLVIGVGRDSARINAARAAGLIDEGATDIATVVDRADVIVFCTPVDHVAIGVRQVAVINAGRSASSLGRPVLLTDAGSVKAPICDELADVPNFIGSHPIAGSHRQGFEAADATLFDGRVCVLTPVPNSSEAQIQRLEQFWQAVGMRTVKMSPAAHDRSLAMTSHLPHVVASALAATLSDENRTLTGSGFRDTTRVAAGDPDLWTGILLNNVDHVCAGIEEIQKQLTLFHDALSSRDPTTIRDLLNQGRLARAALDQVAVAGHSVSHENEGP